MGQYAVVCGSPNLIEEVRNKSIQIHFSTAWICHLGGFTATGGYQAKFIRDTPLMFYNQY